MYASFFGLKTAPFSIAPDPHYLFMSERHREALAHLLYGVGGGGGFVLLTGDIGAGKTTVCRCFLEQIPRRCNVAYIFNPKLTVVELLRSVCDEFRIPLPAQGSALTTVKDYLDPLNEYLLRTHAVGQNNVLIIDEAQNLSPDVLEQLRLLTNLETSERKLLQIILIGQPELRVMLAQPELEQLAQRVIAHFHLQALSELETAQYIRHRLTVAGLKRGHLFDKAAVKRIYQLSQGVPRRINLLCDRALLGAYAGDKMSVDRAIVDKAAQEVFQGHVSQPGARAGSGKQGHARWRQGTWLAIGGLAAAGLTGLAIASWVQQHRHPALASGKGQGAAVSASSASTALTASAPAAAASLTAMGSGLKLSTSAEVMQAAWRAEAPAWVGLGSLWGAQLQEADPCGSAARQGLMCFKGSGGLAAVQQLARPVSLVLKDEQGHEAHALLLDLSPQTATLQVAAQRMRVSTASLASLWRGDFATLWRVPSGYRSKILPGQKGPVVNWLAGRLAALDGQAPPAEPAVFGKQMEARLQAFQLTQGLKPDGVAGATTLMLLNRATGVSEPRLLSDITSSKAGHVLHP